MPRRQTNPPGAQLWARLDRFECECPSCAHIISPYNGRVLNRAGTIPALRPRQAGTPADLRGYDATRVKQQQRKPPDRHLVWNPITQQLRCPYCHRVFVAGLLLYSIAQRRNGRRDQTPWDADPRNLTYAQRLELRGYGGGWYRQQISRHDGEPLNVCVDQPCTCPPRPGWIGTCPVHGAHRPEVEGAQASSEE